MPARQGGERKPASFDGRPVDQSVGRACGVETTVVSCSEAAAAIAVQGGCLAAAAELIVDVLRSTRLLERKQTWMTSDGGFLGG